MHLARVYGRVPLKDLAKFAEESAWQNICEITIRIITWIGDNDIRNQDVSPRNFVIRKHETGLRVCMIDFGSCCYPNGAG